MKILILILTLLFSLSVLADCCNFEVDARPLTTEVHDDCNESATSSPSSHNDAHCGCPHLTHLKILATSSSQLPSSFALWSESPGETYLLKISNFSQSIFHPPKLLC